MLYNAVGRTLAKGKASKGKIWKAPGFTVMYSSKGLDNAETGKLQGGGKFLTHNQVYRQIRAAEGLVTG